MSPEPPEQTDVPANPDAGRPSVEEVVERLDQLWQQEAHSRASFSADHLGQTVGKYLLERIVGRGSFGVVYLAHDSELARDVALKLPRPEVLLDGERLSRFQAEATTAAQLDHPSIVPIFEAELTGPTPYIASPFCSGPDLGQWLATRDSPVAPRQAAQFIARLADAVQYAHNQGVLHRDLKPSNIMLEPCEQLSGDDQLTDYEPRLTDFGLAKLVEASLQDTRSSLLVGTPLYMAPEQLERGSPDVSPTTDVYALGVVLYELLTLKTPFDGDSYVEILDKLRSDQPDEFTAHFAELPIDLQTICSKCLEKSPRDRYQTAAELGADLQHFQAGEPVRAKPITWQNRFTRWCRRPQRILAAGRVTCWFQGLVLIWMHITFFTGIAAGIFDDYWRRAIADYSFVVFSSHLPLFLLGWLVMKGKRWAFWPSAVLSLLFLLIVFEAAFQEAKVFEYLYEGPTSKINTYAAMILGSTLELVAYLVAIPAWFSDRARR